ncbi:plasmid mobilization protein [Pseudonocardia charpentierae]|uniref:plasmid mobilization protein n=1 Tax=Pseudonocardia charpentierae TaxID=3075545 RepID=UPI0037CC82CC
MNIIQRLVLPAQIGGARVEPPVRTTTSRTARAWVRLGFVASSDPVPEVGAAGARRRARAAVARRKSVRVRLTPDEATLIVEAAARAGMSVGAWVGDTALRRGWIIG